MTVITTTDGYVFTRQADGTYSDGDMYGITLSELITNGHDTDGRN